MQTQSHPGFLVKHPTSRIQHTLTYLPSHPTPQVILPGGLTATSTSWLLFTKDEEVRKLMINSHNQ